ncbi:YpbS family protein [Bacillus sp. BRMEA1]|uniref:YpbS family protein n=1 Tax=Neobacillus endophyticus TaxID=2738405 RepID=UPI001566D353|nr:YpbS family protein [Neobacillus endophyticus]NRD76281.1 YpbS family protein [Neobacillus endophyticus]
MSVHKAITEHVNKQNKKINDFVALDQMREQYIEEALELCRQGKAFTTEKINDITQQINELAKKGIVPTRKLVTAEMVREYALKTK